MLPKYEHFKFEVGQFVQSSFVAVQRDVLSRKQIDREVFQVVERMYQECPGGVQLHYLCRPMGAWMSSDRGYVRYNEIELDELDKAVTSEEYRLP